MALDPKVLSMFLGNTNIPDDGTLPPPPPKTKIDAMNLMALMPQFLPKQQGPTTAAAKKLISIADQRQIDAATGQKLGEGNKMNAKVDFELARRIVDGAKKHGVDPATALSIGLNETSLSLPQANKYQPDPYRAANPFMVNGHDEIPGADINEERRNNGDIETFFKVFKNKMEGAKKMGKKDEAALIQAYNGYGKINKGTLYGIDTEKTPIDFNQNPIYGKKILDIRENIVKKNPDLMALINTK